jgi:hypothetical protein
MLHMNTDEDVAEGKITFEEIRALRRYHPLSDCECFDYLALVHRGLSNAFRRFLYGSGSRCSCFLALSLPVSNWLFPIQSNRVAEESVVCSVKPILRFCPYAPLSQIVGSYPLLLPFLSRAGS